MTKSDASNVADPEVPATALALVAAPSTSSSLAPLTEPMPLERDDVGRIVTRAIDAVADALARALEARGALSLSASDPLETALAAAAAAGRWDVVSQLARELEARRLAGSNVVPLADPRRDRR